MFAFMWVVGIWLGVIVICLAGCDNSRKDKVGTVDATGRYFETGSTRAVQIAEIDGCEYLVSPNGYGDIYSHKGNCKNPYHKDNQK